MLAAPADLIQSIHRLEPLPESAIRLASILSRPDWEIEEVVEVISLDPPMTAGLLRAANSVVGGARKQVSTIWDAVVRLGAGCVLALVVGQRSSRLLREAIPGYPLVEGALWRHSVAAALSTELASAVCRIKVPPETHAAALLHDIGKLVIGRYLVGREAAQEFEGARRAAADPLLFEREALGTDHAELGARLTSHWRLPESISEAIAEHHSTRTHSDPVVCLVRLADLTAHAVLDPKATKVPEQALEESVGLKHKGFDTLVARTREGLDAMLLRYS